MDLSRGQHQELMANPSPETMSVNSKVHQKPKLPQPTEQALKCPRCDSTNTKFCYYNNYSLSQPRYFCKSCKRYWTKGGTLRNVPVGGGCRKNKRSSSSTKRAQDTNPLMMINTNNIPPLIYDHNHIDTNDGDDQLSFLGNPILNPVFLGNQNIFQSFCNYGSFGEVDDNGGGCEGYNVETMTRYNNGEIIDSITTTPTTTSNFPVRTMKHDLEHVRDSGLLWGLPWHVIADHGNNNNNMVGDWHGVLNSSLM